MTLNFYSQQPHCIFAADSGVVKNRLSFSLIIFSETHLYHYYYSDQPLRDRYYHHPAVMAEKYDLAETGTDQTQYSGCNKICRG